MIFGKPQDVNKSFIVNYASIFANLRRSEKRLILKKSEVIHYKKGRAIYRQGDPPDAFYCVITGRVKVFRFQDNKEENLEFLTCGMYFGIISLLTTKTHSVSAEAVNDSLILRIKKEDFDFTLKKIPALAIDLSKTLSQQIRSRDFSRSVPKSNIISIYSAIKGMGRTMYAVNLAISLRRETKKKVIFLEISQSGKEIINILNISHIKGPLDLEYSMFKREEVNKFIFKDSGSDTDFLTIKYSPSFNNSTVQISHFLTLLTNDYQYVIVDLPLERSEVIFDALTQSDAIHIITDYDIENLKSTRELMADLFKNVEYPQEKIKVILNEKKDSKKIPYNEILPLLDHDVFANIPVFWEASEKINEDSAKVVLGQPDSEYARAVRRIARQIGDVLVGLALGGGAAFGLAHIGVIKVLERENIPVDVVAGTSMGALVGALWAAGNSGLEIENIMMVYNDRKDKVCTLLGDLCFPKSSLVGGKQIEMFLKKNLGEKTFQDIRFPLMVVSCNLDKREKVVVESGKLIDAVKSSIAIPGIFKPMISENNLIVDGGIIEPVPIETLVKAGIKKIIAVNVLPSPEDIQEGYKNYKYSLEKSAADIQKRNFIIRLFYKLRRILIRIFNPNILDIMVNSLQALEYIVAKEDFRQADVVINPIIPGTKWYEFFKTDSLIKKGEFAAEKALAQIRELVER